MFTPRDERAQSRDERRNLQVPQVALGRSELIRSRTPSPSGVNPGRFNFPPSEEAPVTPNQFENAEGPNMGDATVQALTTALQGMKVSSRKPELPDFDAKNVDIWLKRVSNAYRRAGITDPKDKFAFIETKFSVDSDPRINELIFSDGTDEDWTAFETYLRDRYGRTKAQQTAVILDGVQRNGKLPSEMFAHIKDQIGSITIDDIVKEMVLRELPTDIRRTIHDKVKSLDGAATMKLADDFFDKNGRPIHKTTNPSVSAVSEVPDLVDTEGEEDDVNAVGGRRFPRKNRQWQQRGPQPQKQHQQNGQQRSRPPKPSFTPAFPNERQTNSGKPTVKAINLCRWHKQYGRDAYTCEAGCDRFNEKGAVKAKAGRQA